MVDEKIKFIEEIKKLSNFLDKQYNNELNFRNHCYLRIAYDNVTRDRWDKQIAKPFVKYASIEQLESVIEKLNKYTSDKLVLMSDNDKSLSFRSKYKIDKNGSELQLF
ncbi:MAG: acetyltransferase [Flavobacterium sp.]|nr:acetyltransferase [Flavobacterium sp.]